MPRSTTKPAAPPAIAALVDKFTEHRDQYHRAGYNETLLRRDFLDPFFEVLGWDMTNRQGYAEAYRDVIHEDALRVEKAARAPDYCFRVGGTRKFFVEAKKPAVDIKSDVGPAFQLRRYAWTAKLPLSILTDFEEFAVYDCRKKPDKDDKASEARIMFLNHTEFLTRWDEIAGIFSREAILKGSFDKFAESAKKKRGTAPVDEEFLKEIETWREELAKNLSLRNESLTDRQLNVAVRRIIDRIIFLRMCEGRGIEEYGRLQALLNGDRVYRRLVELFHRADEKYNSGLFHFQNERGREPPDELTPDLTLDDKVLKDILRRLYYPESPYEFAAMPAEILGQVYEQFLGKVIRLTAGHRAKVEEKPEVRKAGGVYYTPTYIVDYIVENTVGRLLEGKTPQAVGGLTATFKPAKSKARGGGNARPLSVLDPACGSGSFLIVAYQYLLDWYLKQYTENGDPQQHARGANPRVYQTASGDWRLTTSERKRILLAHIYGVDIDYQAVEVTKLSLLLKVLEGETEATIQRELFAKQRALPDLADNIKCGNSLIGPEFYLAHQTRLFEEQDRERINVFSWQDEFPQVMAGTDAGFDAIVGNPPYISIQTLSEWAAPEAVFLKMHYSAAAYGNFDIYVVFIERGLQLLSPYGQLAFITPNKYFVTDYGRGIRELIASENALSRIVDFKHGIVFGGVSTYTCLTFLSRDALNQFEHTVVTPPETLANGLAIFRSIDSFSSGMPWSFATNEEETLQQKLQTDTKRLLDLPCSISRGSSTGNDDVFILEVEGDEMRTRDGTVVHVEHDLLRIPIYATDFGRYRFNPLAEERVIFPYDVNSEGYQLIAEDELQARFSNGYEYLRSRREILKRRKQFKTWYSFSAPRNLNDHEAAHLMVPLLANTGLYCRLPNGQMNQYCPMASGGFTLRLPNHNADFVLGLLNSRLLYWRLQNISNVFRGGWVTCTKQYVGTLPIKDERAGTPRRASIEQAVNTVIKLRERLPTMKTSHERHTCERQIAAYEQKIDSVVYDLYGLTDKEIALVERSNRND